MAAKTTLNAKNLEALGAARLAELLIEVSTGSALAKRRLRLELAGAQSPKEAAREVSKRLTTIAAARARVNWRSRKTLVADLDGQLQAIARLAPEYPTEACALTWRLLQIAPSVFRRCEDSSGTVIEVFHRACGLLGEIAAKDRPEALAAEVFDALQENLDGQYDRLIVALAPALGAKGLADLKARVLGLGPVPVPPRADWVAVGPTHVHEIEERARRAVVRMALQDIADVMGDVDAFVAQYGPAHLAMPQIATEIARRLTEAGRVSEALDALDRAAPGDEPWAEARLTALESLGRATEAQAFRLKLFRQSLAPAPLRAYLKKLPDFEDIEAEEQALTHVAAHPDPILALDFLIHWPALPRAAALVLTRRLDGDRYEILTPAAEALADRWPLAATLALRAMIDFTLTAGRSSRYQHAARHLESAAALGPLVADWQGHEPHDAYAAKLRRDHPRKAGFWRALA